MVHTSGQAIAAGAGRWQALLLLAALAATSSFGQDGPLAGSMRLVEDDPEHDLVDDAAVYARPNRPTPYGGRRGRDRS